MLRSGHSRLPDFVASCLAMLLVLLGASIASAQLSDVDSDLVPDAFDNCSDVPNGPAQGGLDQLDTDLDGYGNACDFDYDNSWTLNLLDFPYFLTAFQGAAPNPDTDHDGDGATTTLDFPYFVRAFQGVVPAVGPSGLACAGSVPCSP